MASKPTKMWIDGQCFDIKKLNKRASKGDRSADNSEDTNVVKEALNFELIKNAEGKWSTSFKLPRLYYTQMRAKFQSNLKEIEATTNTVILVPKTFRDFNIVITGDLQANISKARNEVHSIIGTLRDQNSALQFISIPIVNDNIVANFEKFKNDILSGEKIEGMHESIFITHKKLHLTVIVFALLDDSEKNEAVKALEDYKTTVLDPLIAKTGPLMIELSGVGCMQTNLRKVNVLYTIPKITNTDEINLQEIADGILNFFYERGLVQRCQDNVKLHMTLMNTRYRQKDQKMKNKYANQKITFDATSICEKYKDFYFGTCPLNNINLSIRYTEGEDGFYNSLATITTQSESGNVLFEIDSYETTIPNQESPQLSEIPVINCDILYNEFFEKFMNLNSPCIIKGATENWESHQKWTTSEGKPNFEYLKEKYGHCEVPIYNCNERYFNSQEFETDLFSSYIDRWGKKSKYLKDWHLKNLFRDDDFYKVPIYFASDWLNEYSVEKCENDYRFVYMGPKGTWTPFHADVFNSFSWSANVCGQKRWILFPPGEEDLLRDELNNLPYDISENYQNMKHYEVIQNEGEAIFVPSGWYHQVWNLEDTISINHNWINGCNIMNVWYSINHHLKLVQKEIEDCTDMEDYDNHCQVMLASSYGMDFNEFYQILEFIALKRIETLESSPKPSFHEFLIGKNHCLFDLFKIKQVLDEVVLNIKFSNSDSSKKLLQKIETFINSRN